MGQRIRLEVVTPAGAIVDKDVDIVNAQGQGGDFGIMANHEPFLSTLRIGTMVYEVDGKRTPMMVSGGFCEVSGEKVTFLLENAEFGSDIDVKRAMDAKERAERRLAQAAQKDESINRLRAESALQRAVARLKVADMSKVAGM
ncbi:MAG: F0F1 ATP synthase subunit epsilon [Desulfobulbaceae bacterium]|jgi:F-type H+-transporting ATPase subunit epsilon|nr:F0F1 ATP synthase subunit epsilon [Desulfobulbaceae bacterium]